MRIAVISDVHGNHLALDAVLADIEAEGVDAVINLGDMVSGPLAPGRVADRLMAGAFPSVRGNHDRYLLTDAPAQLERVDRFAHGQLTRQHLDWLAGLPLTRELNGEILMCHGTPLDDDVPWLDTWFEGRTTVVPDEAAVRARADGFDFPVIVCGHTHVARVVRLSDGRLVVNPGSVGLQMVLGAPDARYAIIQRRGTKWTVSLKVVPYDFEAAATQAEAQGFPSWRNVLTTGWAGPEGLFQK